MTCATRAADVYCHVTYLQVNHEDKDWFEETILQTIRSSFGGLPADMAQAERVCKELRERPRYCVDFMQPAEEEPETGEDLPRPRVYQVSLLHAVTCCGRGRTCRAQGSIPARPRRDMLGLT